MNHSPFNYAISQHTHKQIEFLMIVLWSAIRLHHDRLIELPIKASPLLTIADGSFNYSKISSEYMLPV